MTSFLRNMIVKWRKEIDGVCVMYFNEEGRDWMILTFMMGRYLREGIEDA